MYRVKVTFNITEEECALIAHLFKETAIESTSIIKYATTVKKGLVATQPNYGKFIIKLTDQGKDAAKQLKRQHRKVQSITNK
jgi:predicted transcriptional regulator